MKRIVLLVFVFALASCSREIPSNEVTKPETTLEKIVIEATEQSNRINVPTLEKPQNLKNFLSKNTKKIDLIFTDLNTSKKKLEINKQGNKPLCVIIGPEGDFSESERNQILNFEGVKPIKINDNILRAETATISVISIINYIINL